MIVAGVRICLVDSPDTSVSFERVGDLYFSGLGTRRAERLLARLNLELQCGTGCGLQARAIASRSGIVI